MIIGEVSAVDLAHVLRETLEGMIQPDRRAPGWDRKWQRLEDFAHDADED